MFNATGMTNKNAISMSDPFSAGGSGNFGGIVGMTGEGSLERPYLGEERYPAGCAFAIVPRESVAVASYLSSRDAAIPCEYGRSQFTEALWN